jgi:hypothetical protein
VQVNFEGVLTDSLHLEWTELQILSVVEYSTKSITFRSRHFFHPPIQQSKASYPGWPWYSESLRTGATAYGSNKLLNTSSIPRAVYSHYNPRHQTANRSIISHNHAESEFYILHTKVNGVRIQMCYFLCVTGFGSLIPDNSTLSSDNCEGGRSVTSVSACVYIYIYVLTISGIRNKKVLAIRVLSILILVSSLTGHDRILVTYFSLPFHHYSFYFF